MEGNEKGEGAQIFCDRIQLASTITARQELVLHFPKKGNNPQSPAAMFLSAHLCIDPLRAFPEK